MPTYLDQYYTVKVLREKYCNTCFLGRHYCHNQCLGNLILNDLEHMDGLSEGDINNFNRAYWGIYG